jgi:hypothetical protein
MHVRRWKTGGTEQSIEMRRSFTPGGRRVCDVCRNLEFSKKDLRTQFQDYQLPTATEE